MAHPALRLTTWVLGPRSSSGATSTDRQWVTTCRSAAKGPHGDALVNETPGDVSDRVTLKAPVTTAKAECGIVSDPLSIASLFSNRHQGLRYSWAVDSNATG